MPTTPEETPFPASSHSPALGVCQSPVCLGRCLFWTLLVNGLTPRVPCCVCPPSLSMVFSWVARLQRVPSFDPFDSRVILHCVNQLHFVYRSPVGGHLNFSTFSILFKIQKLGPNQLLAQGQHLPVTQQFHFWVREMKHVDSESRTQLSTAAYS